MKTNYIVAALLFGLAAALLITFVVWAVRELRVKRRARMMQRQYVRHSVSPIREKKQEKLWQIPFRRRWRK